MGGGRGGENNGAGTAREEGTRGGDATGSVATPPQERPGDECPEVSEEALLL